MDRRKLERAATAAYETYRAGVDGVAVDGDVLPHWPGLKEPIRVAWRMAADAAVIVANGPTEPLPSRWRSCGRATDGTMLYMSDLGTEEAEAGALSTLAPVDEQRAAQAHTAPETSPVEAGPDEDFRPQGHQWP